MNERFWEVICAALPLFVLVFVFDIVLLVFLVVSMLFVRPGSGTYYIGLLSGGLLLCLFFGCAIVIRRCRKR